MLVNVDWFFVSHFLHLARFARDEGWRVALATELGAERDRLVAEGIELVPLPTRRGGLVPRGLGATVQCLADDLRRHPETLLHGFGLFGIFAGTLAADRAGLGNRVFTITGRGYTAVANSPKAILVRALAASFMSRIADRKTVRWIAENRHDLRSCGLANAERDGRTIVVGGAGIDPAIFAPRPMPPRPPLKVALVGRMIWTKGVDTAVAATALARANGLEMELTLAGGIDTANPAAWKASDIEAMARAPGIRWLGRNDDIPGLWADQHLAVLPSRGGEGVPRSLIEAAACGRSIVTTSVPGCCELAADTGGWTVPVDDPAALAQAFAEASAKDLAVKGSEAREAVLHGYTISDNWAATRKLYETLMPIVSGTSPRERTS
ncbi:MAG: glycosyltransferase [Hyphomicrobium sp.]|nr:glycosyltransferase [Hyphomicrobium sp.]